MFSHCKSATLWQAEGRTNGRTDIHTVYHLFNKHMLCTSSTGKCYLNQLRQSNELRLKVLKRLLNKMQVFWEQGVTFRKT
jgi:hypothetical protein